MSDKTERTREEAHAWERYLRETPMVWQLYLGKPEAPTAWLGTFEGVFDALQYLGSLGIANHKILEHTSHEKDSSLMWLLEGSYTSPDNPERVYPYHVQCMVGAASWKTKPYTLKRVLYNEEDK